SSLKDISVPENAIAFGEIGLSGEIRSVSNITQRVNEAVRLGFNKIIIPYNNLRSLEKAKISSDAQITGVRSIREAFDAVIG
ncbi:MAG: magnesium chelatase domain-containing protein, partial [Acutalibacteraceae bacterium]